MLVGSHNVLQEVPLFVCQSHQSLQSFVTEHYGPQIWIGDQGPKRLEDRMTSVTSVFEGPKCTYFQHLTCSKKTFRNQG